VDTGLGGERAKPPTVAGVLHGDPASGPSTATAF
jgi:hypothetical protein